MFPFFALTLTCPSMLVISFQSKHSPSLIPGKDFPLFLIRTVTLFPLRPPLSNCTSFYSILLDPLYSALVNWSFSCSFSAGSALMTHFSKLICSFCGMSSEPPCASRWSRGAVRVRSKHTHGRGRGRRRTEMRMERMQMHPGTLCGGPTDGHFYVRMHPPRPAAET